MSLFEVMWVPLSVIIWIALIFILLKNALKAKKEGKILYSILLVLIAIFIVIFSGQFVVFLVWAYGCGLGLPLGCIK